MSVSDGMENNPALMLMHEYMMTVSLALLGSVMELHRGLDLDQPLSQEELFSVMMMFICETRGKRTVSHTSGH